MKGDCQGMDWPAKHELFGVSLSATDYQQAEDLLIEAAGRRQSACVTHLPVHGVVQAVLDRGYRQRINSFELTAPDGQPVRWAMNRFFKTRLPDRVYGPELMLRLCARAASAGIGVYLYGSTPEVVTSLAANLQRRFAGLRIVGAESPPFRPLTGEEDRQAVQRINDSGAGLLFLGLGLPRQDHFAYEHRHSIRAVQVCVGAAFDFHAGTVPMAPGWMQRRGLEWLFRLCKEPRRLWRRYVVTNSLFLLLMGRRWLLGW